MKDVTLCNKEARHLCSCLFRHPVRLAKVAHTRGLQRSRMEQKRHFEATHSSSVMQFILGRNFLIPWNCISQLTLHGDQSDSHLMIMLLAAKGISRLLSLTSSTCFYRFVEHSVNLRHTQMLPLGMSIGSTVTGGRKVS